jgi:nicotinamidase-related amidase
MSEFFELFDALDRDRDGSLTREELFRAAVELGWHWQQAHLYALLDFLTLRSPLDRESFAACLEEATHDPQGVFGRVLLRGPLGRRPSDVSGRVRNEAVKSPGDRVLWGGTGSDGTDRLLRDIVSSERAGDFAEALKRSAVPSYSVRSGETALLIIDPQRAFTAGEWMWRLGPVGDMEVMPIQLAFDNCARLLETVYGRVEAMFSRCPFSAESYGWDDKLDAILDEDQLYFIKPSNNLFMPESNGYNEWLEALIEGGIRTLVMGGCTLNSCLRVSAVATRNAFPRESLEVVVDLSLCGARTSNYLNAEQFGGFSPVEAAMREMTASGVSVAGQVVWM